MRGIKNARIASRARFSRPNWQQKKTHWWIRQSERNCWIEKWIDALPVIWSILHARHTQGQWVNQSDDAMQSKSNEKKRKKKKIEERKTSNDMIAVDEVDKIEIGRNSKWFEIEKNELQTLSTLSRPSVLIHARTLHIK